MMRPSKLVRHLMIASCAVVLQLSYEKRQVVEHVVLDKWQWNNCHYFNTNVKLTGRQLQREVKASRQRREELQQRAPQASMLPRGSSYNPDSSARVS